MKSPSLFKRLACMLYESVLLIAILALATFIFLKIFGAATQSPLRYFLQFYLWLIAGAYFIYCWMKSGQTLAMQTWRIQLLGHGDQPMPFRQAAIRYVIASFSLLLFGLGFFWAIFDREGLYLHDRFTGGRLVMLAK
jgi:uncharacterized RDD family membrane protein YckC